MYRQPAVRGAEIIGDTVADGLFADGMRLPSGSTLTSADINRISVIHPVLS